MSTPAKVASITIDWGEQDKPEGDRRSWLSSWIVSADGEEGEFLFDGVGGTTTVHKIPAEAVGIRFRWAPRAAGDMQNPFRQWVTLRKLYLFDEHPESAVNAMDFCS